MAASPFIVTATLTTAGITFWMMGDRLGSVCGVRFCVCAQPDGAKDARTSEAPSAEARRAPRKLRFGASTENPFDKRRQSIIVLLNAPWPTVPLNSCRRLSAGIPVVGLESIAFEDLQRVRRADKGEPGPGCFGVHGPLHLARLGSRRDRQAWQCARGCASAPAAIPSPIEGDATSGRAASMTLPLVTFPLVLSTTSMSRQFKFLIPSRP